MFLSIRNERTIKDLQQDFNDEFPYLQLAFFDHKHKTGQSNNISDMLSNELTLSDIRRSDQEGNIFVSPNLKVSELENLFSELYELNVQVQRKSGNIWLVTTATDDWSLEKQNTEGESFSKPY